MTTLPQMAAVLQTVLTQVADACAQRTGAVQRVRKFSGATLVQTLVLGWLGQPTATLEALAQTAASLGVTISPQGLDQRFTPATATCLGEVLEYAVGALVSADPVALPLIARFRAVLVQDSTVVALPDALEGIWRGTGERTGHNRAALKATVRLDLLEGQLAGPLLSAGRTHDRRAAQPLPPIPAGALLVQDLGYFCLEEFARLGAGGAFFLSRLKTRTWVGDPAGRRLPDLTQWLAAQGTGVVDLPVHLGAGRPLPVRLLAVQVPRAVATERRRKLRAQAKHKGQAVSQERLRLAGWTVLVTNAPPNLLSLEEALVLYRARWQIELLFKLWKQHGQVDTWRSAQPWRILCEVYAKLLGLLVHHWLLLTSCWQFPNRSWVKALQTVRRSAALLLGALRGLLPLTVALEQIARTLAAGCRLNRRKQHPSTYQLLLNWSSGYDATPAA